jgi:hypothetical protein
MYTKYSCSLLANLISVVCNSEGGVVREDSCKFGCDSQCR